MKLKRYILFSIALMLSLNTFAQLFQDGEKLYYKVAYKAKMVPNTVVAKVTMETRADTLAGRPMHHIYGIGETMPFFNMFFKMHDEYNVWIDHQTKKTYRFENSLNEGKYTFKSNYLFNWDDMVAYTWAQSRNKEPRSAVINLTPNSMDAISLYFNMRTLSAEDFKEGETQEIEMLLDNGIKHLRLRYLGIEECKVPKMATYRCLKFACTLGSVEEFSFTDGSEFLIWITDDGNKFPVMLQSPVKVGQVRAYISGYEGLKYPIGCIVDKK